MDIDRYTPEQYNTHRIEHFIFQPPSKDVTVLIVTDDQKTIKIKINIQQFLDVMSTTQKDTVKLFLKKIGAAALGVADASINGEAFE